MRGTEPGRSLARFTGINPASSPRTIHSEKALIMADPILEEIWRVRESLVRRHGGVDGYVKYVQRLDRARRQQRRRPGRSRRSAARAAKAK